MFKKSKVERRKPEVVKKQLYFWLLPIAYFLLPMASNAQCAMCRAALSGESNKAQAQAVNDGIVYLMIIPYILVGAIGYYIYWMRKNKKQ